MYRGNRMIDIMNTEEIAKELGVSADRVREIARTRHVGFKKGRDWLFTRGDIEKMRPGRPGPHPLFTPDTVIDHIVELENQGIITDVSEVSVKVRGHKGDEVLRKLKHTSGRTLFIVRVKPQNK
jgi:predicted peroxiredoxin